MSSKQALRDLNYYFQQASFTGGEISPDMAGRVDYTKYETSLSDLTNMYALPYGGVLSRVGTEFIMDLGASSLKVQMIPFTFNNEQNIVMLFCSDGYVYFLAGGGYITQDGENPYKIQHTYNADQIGNLKYAQSADVVILCNNTSPVKQVVRHGTYDWSFENFTTDSGSPYEKLNDTGAYVTYADNILTCSQSLFSSTDVGRGVRVDEAVAATEAHVSDENLEDYTSEWLPCKGDWSLIMSGSVSGDIYIEKSRDNGKTTENLKHWNLTDLGSLQDSGTEDELCKIRLRVTSSSTSGSVQLNSDSFVNSVYMQITAYTSPTQVSVSVYTSDQDKAWGFLNGSNKQFYFALGEWSAGNGYPRAVTFFQDRLVFASTTQNPLGLWISANGDYPNFKTSVEDVADEDAINVMLVSQNMNATQALSAKNDLIAFTGGGVWRINSRSAAQGLSASTITAQQQNFDGANNLQPLPISGYFLYTLDLGSTIKDIAYSYSQDAYVGTDLTLLAKHLFKNHEIIAWCFAQEPDALLWAVRDDGLLLSLTYVKDQEVFAWSKHTTQGKFRDICSVQGDNISDVYLVVERNGKLYVEFMAHREIDNTSLLNYMDCSAVYEGEPTAVISGIDYLEGQTVQILADGSEQPEQTVIDGKINLSYPASTVRVGLGYNKTLTTTDIYVARQDGTSIGRKKSIGVLKLLLQDSWGGEVEIIGNSKTRIIQKRLPLRYNAPLELESGLISVPINSTYDERLYIKLSQSSPVPLNVLSILADIAIGG